MMNKAINKVAWAVLNQDEKMALNLALLERKSTWEAGEMMGKSHYKYLEIKSRAEYLLKLFQTHFYAFGDELLPENLSGEKEIKEYFNLTIQGRKKVFEAAKILNEKYGFLTRTARNKEIVKQMVKWRDSQNAYDQTVFHLIQDFDRWNNFRILPPELQEPSAFKRRHKNSHKKHIKYTCIMPDVSVIFLKDHLEPKTKVKPKKLLYFPFITLSKEIHILEVKEQALKEITPFQLYLFDTYELAQEYIELVADYALKKGRACKEGLEFWPKYREIIKKAINYDKIQHITPNRQFLEVALKELTYV